MTEDAPNLDNPEGVVLLAGGRVLRFDRQVDSTGYIHCFDGPLIGKPGLSPQSARTAGSA